MSIFLKNSIKMIVCGFLLVYLLKAAEFSALPSQSEEGSGSKMKVLPSFIREDGKPIARVYAEVLNSDLTFIKNGTRFSATIQIELFLQNKENEVVFTKAVSKRVDAERFNDTNSLEISNIVSLDIPIKTGDYQVVLIITDVVSAKQFSYKAGLKFGKTFTGDGREGLGNILFLADCQTDSSGKIVDFTPSLTGRFSKKRKFIYAWVRTYKHSPETPLKVRYQVKNEQGMIIQRNQYTVPGRQSGLVEHFIRLNRYLFKHSRYTLEVFVNADGQAPLSVSESFVLSWQFLPVSMADLNIGIRQLCYIADSDSVKHYLTASEQARKAFLLRFWKKQDPTPATKENELMTEYYRRIEFANQAFGGAGKEGWETDRGRICVKFGKPDEIERHPFETRSNPYIVWRYYRLRKTFLFVDRSGFGDYALHPSYYHVEFE